VATVITYLSTAMPGVDVHRQVPGARPSQWLRVLRTGGVRHTYVSDAAQLTIEAWADTPADAADLAQLARAHLNAIVGADAYLVEELGGPADLPDPESQQHRYTWSALVHLRGAAL
jgi:hypothetical protein